MAQLFGHEKLRVYHKGLDFVEIRRGVLQGLSRRVAACERLDRGAESILVKHKLTVTHTLKPTLKRLHVLHPLKRWPDESVHEEMNP